MEQFVINVVAAGGGGALIFLGLKAFGGKWLDSRFNKQLQSLHHSHERDLEAFRFGITQMLDRSNRLSAREFEVLPEAWALVFDAYVETERLLQRLKSIPDVGKLHGKALEELPNAPSNLPRFAAQSTRYDRG
jgi:hypothetical protein